MKVKLKRLDPMAQLPKYAKLGDAAMDLVAVGVEIHDAFTQYSLGFSIEIPDGYVGLIFPRSSISNIPNCSLANSVGVIDSGYRGEVSVRFRGYVPYKLGERIAQLMILPVPSIEFEEVSELSETVRGGGGYGSSGKK